MVWNFTNSKFARKLLRVNVTVVNHYPDTQSDHQCFELITHYSATTVMDTSTLIF
jgi:hypothetical protein